MPEPQPSRPIGAHVPVAGGLATGGLRYATAIHAEAVAVFVSNPRTWALAAGNPDEDTTFRDHVTAHRMPVFVHAPYLINLGSPDPVTGQRSTAALAHSLRRARDIGAVGVVVHAGSAVDGDRGKGLRRVAERLAPLLDALGGDGPDLLIEPMAGQGQTLCSSIGDLGPYLEALAWHPRLGVCLDTCHVFAAGHDLTQPTGVASLLRAFAGAAGGDSRPAGPSRLRLIHANDSADGCGSHRDRHANIGAGQIGAASFAALLHHPGTSGVPFIVETPGPREAHAADVATLKRLRRDARTGRGGGCTERPPGRRAHRGGPSPGSSW